MSHEIWIRLCSLFSLLNYENQFFINDPRNEEDSVMEYALE